VEKTVRILMVEDALTDAELEVRELKRAGLPVVHRLVETESAYRDALRDFGPDLIISDFSMPHFDGMRALEIVRELAPGVPFIFVSGTIGEEYAIRALKSGATDYVLKNNLVRLPAAVERALEDAKARALRERMERELRESHERFQALLETAPDAIVLVDSIGKMVLGNAEMERVFGYKRDELLGKSVDMLVPDASRPSHAGHRSVYLADPRIRRMAAKSDLLGRRKDGSLIPVEISLSPVVFNNETHVIGIVRDVTDRRVQERKIARLSRIQAVLSGINSAIVRIRDRQQLFDEACRIAVEHGNFGMAWIGLLDAAAMEVTPVAWAGLETSEYLAGEKALIRDDLPTGKGVIARAIKERVPVYDNDITIAPETGGKRRQEAIRRGYRSVVGLPLIVEGDVVGSLSLFAREAGFFDDEEMKLLTELSGDISFALEHIAGQARIEKLSRIRAVLSSINAAIVRIREREALLRETCRIASEEGKFEMVWIGMLDLEQKQVRAVAWAGFSEETARKVNWATVEGTRGSIAEAIRTKKAAVRNDVESGTPAGMLRQEAIKRGCYSTTSLPLVVDERVVGIIALYAAGRGAFDEDELALLGDAASNVSFALESIASQGKIERLSRIRNVLGDMNAAIVRIRDKRQLLEEACRIALNRGKFAMTWIGILDNAAQAVTPVAKAGRDEGYLERINLSIDPNITRNLALAVEAIARRAPVICNDIATDGRMRPWRTAALERGYRSNVMLPLLVDEQAVGVFALYSPELGFFDEEEMKLLVELAGDIGFALQTIEKQEKLDYLSYYDPLTGLPNRTLFHDRVNHALQTQRDSGGLAALLFLDLQRFGILNDTYGRQTGDALLKLVAERLASVLESRDFLARIDGDTFATVLRDVKHEAEIAHILEENILKALGRPFETAGVKIRTAAQAGVALFPGDGTDAETLFRNADAALAKAKDSGDVYLFYAPQMNARVADQLKLENDLRNALMHEQYVLHYQPRIDLAGGQIVGMEALIRWKHPERGMVSPGEFIPLLEETGMILDVGRWALRRAALQHAAWRTSGRLPPRIAVNVSPAQLRRRDFVDHVNDALAPVERAAERIDIEITESMLMEDIKGSIDKLKVLQSSGLYVALDDFGTGYSSLSYLARLPINSLKIDRSFIQQMSKGPEQMAIVSTVISLARALNLKVVAEGVETEEQANLLRLLRCDEAQGYLFGRPVPPEELEGKLRQA
jgi:PAS domain S-box-containing protein/diguanylate cyclase (GGDEF)-like protein